MNNSGAFSIFSMLYNHQTALVSKHFHHPKRKPHTHPIPSIPGQGKHKSASVSMDYWFVLFCLFGLFLIVKVMYCLEKKKHSKKWKSLAHLLPFKPHFPEIITRRHGRHTYTWCVHTSYCLFKWDYTVLGNINISAITCLETINEVSSQGFAQVHFQAYPKRAD